MKIKRTSFPVRILLFVLIFALTASLFSQGILLKSAPTHITEKSPPIRIKRVVLDAGHGGEDGGAVSASGLVEKEVNLKIARMLAEMLRANGIEVIMTRERDELLYDKNADYKGRKKVLDLLGRRTVAEEHEDAVFVSIHMNTHPIESCRGLQVWYSPNNTMSRVLAENVQSTTKDLLQPQNHRTVKAASSAIYLLHKLQMPAVLIECGFLSNEEEAALLGEEEYCRKLALCLFLSIAQNDFSN